ncbi:response regulator transcription factor [Paraburkholderia sp. SIMBA_055]|jgi:DNA-binding NarL/FixJ family response regulator|uniref:Two component transcriptional regulator, LuxR family n=2 Tax=Paraburkholderia graminis TaxID=60548 RepID=B1FWT2_PARG4|nr:MULTISPECIES: response regulator transcription factor [Paraburkholderia]ALE53619.1 LuxR family transcriptional regulator [Burkholderia sp. HB1]AXF06820.1 DNA-binding response regulator [Paraburkholderia graminis]EDT11832.1 two component transcriptional regulator, LuxR family [Paraburkholderia graminis C4D1M]MDQ0621654.1 two-component system capsular synthesis response regulator RcsB [Paraburkholderia graminis]MDR6201657.1 two-component system capsular synthesis response regulator RcsB [Para
MGDTAAISTPVRAIIADDHPLVLLAIENLIGGYPSMEVVGRAADATELFAEVDRTGCDLVLMDLYMPGGADGSGVEAVRQFRRRYPDVALIVLTMETEAAALQSVISLGVDALISKRDRIDLIHVAIVTALAGECYLGPAVRTLITKAAAMQRLDFVRSVLSRRELEVFTQYASGLGVTEIAGRLGRSVKTISAQKCTAMRKLSLNSDAELFRFAVEHGVVSETHTEGR